MPEPLVVSSIALAIGVTPLLLLSRRLVVRGLEVQIQVLKRQVVTWQSMHDHQVASMDRRLLDLEECAARAEEESRIVSLQMQRMSQMLRNRDAVLAAGGGW